MDITHEKLQDAFEQAEIIKFHDELNIVAIWYGGAYISVRNTQNLEEDVVQGVGSDEVTEETLEEAMELIIDQMGIET
jgi:hypothetical protein